MKEMSMKNDYINMANGNQEMMSIRWRHEENCPGEEMACGEAHALEEEMKKKWKTSRRIQAI